MITPEDIAVARELLVDDVYHASTIFSPGDRWLDVGCHAGYFSLLALMHGASVVGGVDADPDRFDEYQYGAQFLCNLSTGNDLRTLIETTGANAVKLDIQGAERFLIEGSGAECLERINKVVVEWHYLTTVVDILDVLEDRGFKSIYCDSATDILTNQDTYIVYSRRTR